MAERKQDTEAAVPRHIAVIMDGNGRWAKKRGMPRMAGHAVGAETFMKVARYCRSIGVQYLTVYAFSTENWKRPQEEVDGLMTLLEKYMRTAIDSMQRDGIRLHFFGDKDTLSPKLRKLLRETEDFAETMDTPYQANICFNYGGRDEIVRAARAWAERVQAGETAELTEEAFGGLLDSAGIPDPDLVIRSGGEQRLSNFLLWQCAYAELYFTDTLWPDFDGTEIDRAIAAFRERDRRYGGV